MTDIVRQSIAVVVGPEPQINIARQSLAIVIGPALQVNIARQSVAAVLQPVPTPVGPPVRMLSINAFDNKEV